MEHLDSEALRAYSPVPRIAFHQDNFFFYEYIFIIFSDEENGNYKEQDEMVFSCDYQLQQVSVSNHLSEIWKYFQHGWI